MIYENMYMHQLLQCLLKFQAVCYADAIECFLVVTAAQKKREDEGKDETAGSTNPPNMLR